MEKQNVFLIIKQRIDIKPKIKKKKTEENEKRAYPTAGIDGGPHRAVAEVNQLPNVVNVLIGAVGEHGAAAGEVEAVAVVADPVLHGLLDGELAVRHISVPGDVAAGRPREGVAIAVRRGDAALEGFGLRGTVALAVHHLVARVADGARVVLAWGVLAERDVAGRVAKCGGGNRERGGSGVVVRGEI